MKVLWRRLKTFVASVFERFSQKLTQWSWGFGFINFFVVKTKELPAVLEVSIVSGGVKRVSDFALELVEGTVPPRGICPWGLTTACRVAFYGGE